MKSVHDFVVTPKGERYNNTKQLDGGELILNTEIFNHEFVNREATVTATPLVGHADIRAGDTVSVHHNVFRRWHNVKGIEKNCIISEFSLSTQFAPNFNIFKISQAF